jgi:GntR family transcriptional regulator
VIETSISPADAELQEKLQLRSDEEVLSLLRLRLADNQPVALDLSLLPLSRMPELRHIDFSSQSIYGSMRQLHGIRLSWADETIEAIAASSEEADILHIKRGSPILSIRRVVYSADKIPVEVAWTRYPGGKYRASIHLPMTPSH